MNPYGITEVDIPGALAAAQAYQNNRIQQMLAQRQIQAADQQAERDAGVNQVIARYTMQGQPGGAGGAYSGQSGASPQAPAQPQSAPQGLPALTPQDEMTLRTGGERGQQFAEAIQRMTAAQRSQTLLRARAGLTVAQGLMGVPAERRAAVFQQNAPLLLAQGFQPQELQALAQEGFTDDVLRRHMEDSSLAARFADPSYRNVEGEVLDERLLGTGQDPRVYSSEFISTPAGMGSRPGGRNFSGSPPAPPPPAVGTVQGGYRFRGGDPGDRQNWEPAAQPSSSATPAWATPVDGGAGPGQQGFR